MKGGKGSSYSKDDLIKLLKKLGLVVDCTGGKGKQLGKGDHQVYVHPEFRDVKIVIPTAEKDLKENVMSNICDSLVIIMIVTGIDTNQFKRKEGIEGKIMKTVNNARKNLNVLFSTSVKNHLNLSDDEDVRVYIQSKIEQYQDINKFDAV